MSRRHKKSDVAPLTHQEVRAHAKAERARVRRELRGDPESEPGVEWKPPRHSGNVPTNEDVLARRRKFWKQPFWKRRKAVRRSRGEQS
jgi:hypothetical protein